MKLVISKPAAKDLDTLDPDIERQIREELKKMIANPRNVGLRKLKGKKNLWRLKIKEYRAVIELNKKLGTATVLRVKIRGKIGYDRT